MIKLYLRFWCLVALVGMALQSGAAAAHLAASEARIQDHLRIRLEQTAQPKGVHVAGATLNTPDRVRHFYQQRFYRPAWTDISHTRPALDAFLATIEGMAHEGLDPRLYHLEHLERLLHSMRHMHPNTPTLPAVHVAELDILLTDAFLSMATHLVVGRRPEPTGAYTREGALFDPTLLLQAGLESQTPASVIQALLPSQVAYVRLRQALAHDRRIEAAGGWPAFPAGAIVKQGMWRHRVRLLRARLQATGDLEGPAAAPPSAVGVPPLPAEALFDEPLEQAVRAVQQRHGLAVDGVVGSKTLEALNVPVRERIRQLTLNMARWRQNFRHLGERYIVVNIPAYRLDIINQGRSDMQMRVVVGKPPWRTPVFQSTMTHLVVNPYWFVPPGIMKREVLPQVRQNPAYLQTQQMELLAGRHETSRIVDPAQIDWTTAATDPFPYRIRQRPGPHNALGRIKFDFPNPYYVYLHDTPARALFERPERAFRTGQLITVAHCGIAR